MKKFNEFIKEDLFKGDTRMKEYEKLLYNSFINFLKDEWSIEATVILKKKPHSNIFGSVTLSDATINKGRFILYFDPKSSVLNVFKTLLHEMTHVKQISEGRLRPNEKWNSLLFDDDYEISVRDYNKLLKSGNISKYKQLPWEVEAYDNMSREDIIKQYINSDYLNKIKDKDINIEFIIDNIF